MKQQEAKLLDRWLSDKSFINWAKNTNAKDVQQWEAYLDQHPEHRELAATGQFAVLKMVAKPVEIDEERSQLALQELRNRISKLDPLMTPKEKIIPFYRRWQSAAAILLLLGLTSLSYIFYDKTNGEILVATHSEEIHTFALTDQSKVTLNANSTLRYNKHNSRQVWLEGEALFEVAKKPATKETFQVITQDLTVNVLGTVFNVNSRHEQTEVFLAEGKVALQLDQKEQSVIEMQPGELLSYSKGQQKIAKKTQSEASEHISWKEGIIRFKEATLLEALQEVSAIYGLVYDVNNLSSNEELFSGGVPIDNLTITLETLNTVYGVKMIVEDKQLNFN